MASSRTLFVLASLVFLGVVQHGQAEDPPSDSSLLALRHKLKAMSAPEPKLKSSVMLATPGAVDHAAAAAQQHGPMRREGLHSMAQASATAAAGSNRTSIPGNAATSAEFHHALIRQIFMLCVCMYGSIGVLWTFYWQRQKSSGMGMGMGVQEVSQGLERFYIGLLCISWASMSVGMHVLNKSLAGYLQAPAIISGAQMLMAVFIMGFTSGNQLFSVPHAQLKRWLVVPVLFAGMLCSSFYAYERISLSLLTVVRNLTPLVALPIESVIMPPDKRPVVSAPIVTSILVMLVGALVYGDSVLPTLSFIGLGYAVMNMALAVTDRLMQRRLLTQECKDLPSGVCTIVNNALGLVPTLGLAAATHQFSEMATPAHRGNWTDPRVMALLTLSGFVGIGICYLGFQCQRAISATSFFVLQNVSKVAVVSAGVVFFGDPIKSYHSIFGLMLSLGGSFMYGAVNMMHTPAKPAAGDACRREAAEEAQEAPPAEGGRAAGDEHLRHRTSAA